MLSLIALAILLRMEVPRTTALTIIRTVVMATPTLGSSNTSRCEGQGNLGLLGVGGACVDLLCSVHRHWPNDTLGHEDGDCLAREGGGDLLQRRTTDKTKKKSESAYRDL